MSSSLAASDENFNNNENPQQSTEEETKQEEAYQVQQGGQVQEGGGEEVELLSSIEDGRRQVDLKQDQEPAQTNNNNTGIDRFEDHFTLKLPSSSVRFRGTQVQIHELRTSQIQLEQLDDDRILVKNIKNEKTCGINLLRFLYSIVSVFFTGILFILCFLLLLFLFMDLVAHVGATVQPRSIIEFIGSLLAVPIFVYGLASAMALAGGFVADTWNGHVFLRTVGNWSVVWMEWVAFVVFLGIPIITWIITLFQGTDRWWAITSMTWFCSVAVLCTFYAIAVVYYEVQASCQILCELQDGNDNPSRWDLFRCALKARQVYQLSGSVRYVRMTNIEQEDQVPKHDLTSLFSRLTLLPCCTRLFQKVDPPERLYSTEDILGTRRFVTSNTWSLENIYCSSQRSQSIAIVRGPSALLPSQMRSSLVCSIGGSILALLMFVALLVWIEGSFVLILVVCLLIVLSCIPRAKSTFRVYKMYRDVINAQAEESTEIGSTETGGIFQTYERYRVSRPVPLLCWFMFIVEFGILFLWPVLTMFLTGNYQVGIVFLLVSIISAIRYYLNPAILIKELGSFEIVRPQDEKSTTESGPYGDRGWKAKSRLTSIWLNVSRASTRRVWVWVFIILAVIIIVFAVASVGTSYEDSTTDAQEIVILQNFTYDPAPNLPYPTCRLAKGLEIPLSNSTALADYAFLAVLSYMPQENFQETLDAWFGEGIAKDEEGIVKSFRQVVKGGQAAVSYHLVSFPGRFAVVVVRGSTTPWEWLTDAQLWGAAAVAGIFRAILPFGQIWTPILDQLLKALSWVESDNLEEVALYKQTTTFVEAIKASGNYTSLHITGQSLGGGISLITGAQTGIPAIAISGPNLKMSRKTFDPSIGEDAINQYLFNVVPERDMVPRVDDLGLLYQRIGCRGPKNDIWACHSSVRSLCEIMYTCGSANRPALCDCATRFGYPEARRVAGNSSFTDLCGTKRSNDG